MTAKERAINNKDFAKDLAELCNKATFSNQSMEIFETSKERRARIINEKSLLQAQGKPNSSLLHLKRHKQLASTEKIGKRFDYPVYLVSEDYHIAEERQNKEQYGLVMYPNRPINDQIEYFKSQNIKRVAKQNIKQQSVKKEKKAVSSPHSKRKTS